MTNITSETIKHLREATGAGMADCKKALTETAGNMEEAVDWLRKKGLSAASKKSGRVAAEGLVAIAGSGKNAAMIELNAETDFVARNDQFQALVKSIAELALKDGNDVEKLKKVTLPTGRTVSDEIAHSIGVIGENMNLRRSTKLSVTKGVVASYMHNSIAPNQGKIGVLVALESDAPADKLEAFGRQLAMHIAATRPESVTVAELDPALIARERAVFKEQAMASGKPAEIAEKMVEGRLRKYYEESVLLEQVFVIDGKTKVSQAIADMGKELGAAVSVAGIARFTLGEGIEKEQSDFAAEVAKAAGAA